MKKLIAVLLCLSALLSVCACTNAKEPEQNQHVDENDEKPATEYHETVLIEGGRKKVFETDAEKTPLIHDALLSYYDREYSTFLEKLLLADAAGEFDPVTYFIVGYMYFFGLGVEQDMDKAEQYFAAGEKYNEVGCILYLGSVNIRNKDKKDFEKAEKYFKRALELGNEDAYFDLWSLYAQYYDATEENKKKADELLEKALEAKNAPSIYNIGINMVKNTERFTKEENQRGLELLVMAGDLGMADAYIWVADAYEMGYAGVQDAGKAYEYFLKGAETFELTDWYDDVGYCYEEGVGVEQDYAKAVEYYELATRDNFAMSWYDLGRMYENGLGVEKDLGKAVDCYIKAVYGRGDCPYAEPQLKSILDAMK